MMNEENFPEQVVFNLNRPGFHVAYVTYKEKIFAAYCPEDFHGPSSAIIKLMQSLFDEHRDHSFFILRNRLFTTAPLSLQCKGMVKVIAKRASGDIRPEDHGLEVPQQVEILGDEQPFATLQLLTPENRLSLKEISELKVPRAIDWVTQVARLNPRGEVLHDYDRDIACILVDKSGEILSYGLNCNSKNKTLHAEVNMVQRLYHETGCKIPAGAKLFTTRKPCKMCAAMIYDWSEDPRTLHVSFAEEDKSSQHTVLDAVAHWNRLDSV